MERVSEFRIRAHYGGTVVRSSEEWKNERITLRTWNPNDYGITVELTAEKAFELIEALKEALAILPCKVSL